MPRSGRDRKTRRRERRRAEQDAPAEALSSRSDNQPPPRRTEQAEAAHGGEGGDPCPTVRMSDDEQRFPMQMLTESPAGGETTMIDLLMQSVGDGLRSKDARRRRSAERTALQMEKINQADEHHAQELKIKQALLEQKGGHVDASIPTGVVLLERPCVTVEEWESVKAEAESDPQVGSIPDCEPHREDSA